MKLAKIANTVLNINISTEIAQKYGSDLAILLEYIRSWINCNRRKDQNLHKSKYWTFNSLNSICEELPIWSRSKLHRVIQKARKLGLLVIDRFNKWKSDRTNWYALTEIAERLFPEPSGPPNMSKIKSPNLRCNSQVHDFKHIPHAGFRDPKSGTTIPMSLHNNKDLTNNSSNTKICEAVFCDSSSENVRELELLAARIAMLTEERGKLEIRDVEEGKKLASLQDDHKALYKHMQYLGEMRGRIDIITAELLKLNAKATALASTQHIADVITTQIDYVLNKPGERTLSQQLFSKISRTLESLKFKAETLIKLVNEIVYEVRFGTLSKKSTKGKDLTVEHAVNIALKLVRENRWRSQVTFESMTVSPI